ncbi:MAG: class I SAM-dependent methyltransferase [Chitinophagaceae bacterium]|jgi:SAM-dependent methyltransferase
MDNNRLSTKEFWIADRGADFTFRRTENKHPYDYLIKKYIPPVKEGSALEIGSYPGNHLTTFGLLGYTLNGVDFNPDNTKGLPTWLQSEGFKIGQFTNDDFFEYQPDELFDVVSSFGFVEHFENFEEVILRHWELTKPGGYLVITAPNFYGWLQYWLHKTFDKENLAIHNVYSMRPEVWSSLLKKHGCEILYSGYFGGFAFWKGKPKLNLIKRAMIWVIERVIIRVSPLIRFESKAFSAHCGIVAHKKINQ